VARLTAIVAAFRRAMFGRRSERLDPDQLALALEEASQEIAEDRAAEDAAEPTRERRRGPAGAAPTAARCRSISRAWRR
jgi:hypothetical protein